MKKLILIILALLMVAPAFAESRVDKAMRLLDERITEVGPDAVAKKLREAQQDATEASESVIKALTQRGKPRGLCNDQLVLIQDASESIEDAINTLKSTKKMISTKVKSGSRGAVSRVISQKMTKFKKLQDKIEVFYEELSKKCPRI